MKRTSQLMIVLIFIFTALSCSDETSPEATPNMATLTFKLNQEGVSTTNAAPDYEKVISKVVFIDGLPKLTSDKLVEVPIVNANTNEVSYAYVLRSEFEKAQTQPGQNAVESSGCDFSIKEGFGFTGRCFEYGTFYTGTNCVTLFVPCGMSCYTFGTICPAWDEAFA